MILAAVVVAVSCKDYSIHSIVPKKGVLARVGDNVLYENEVVSIFSPGMEAGDSVKLLQSYIDRWVKTQLKVQEAEKVFESTQDDIDKMVRDYRNALLTNKIDQYYIDRSIDTLFPKELISRYYDDNKKDFILDKSIIKGVAIKFPQGYRQQADLKKLMISPRKDDYQDMVDIASKNNFEIVEFVNWTDFGQLQAILPIPEKGGYDYLLDKSKVHEIRSGNDICLVKISEILGPGDYSPLENVQDVIKRLIFNKRKQEIIELQEDSLYIQALKKKGVIINVSNS